MARRWRLELCISSLEAVFNLRCSSRASSNSAVFFHVRNSSICRSRSFACSQRHCLARSPCSFQERRNGLFILRCYSSKARGHREQKHKDLYAIMGVSPKATQVQIKEAYYRLSMKYHPDRNKGSEDAHQKFTELTEAYSILGQYDLRRKYDRGLLNEYRRPPSHTHSDHTSHGHGVGASGPSTVSGQKSKFDFDEFYRAHYGKALRREQEARKRRAAAREKAKHYSISNSMQQVLIAGLCISVILVSLYGYQRMHQTNRTTTHNE